MLTKLDVTGADEAVDRVAHELCREPLTISAVTGRGIPQLVARIGELLDRLRAEEASKAEAAVAEAARGDRDD